MSSPQRIQSFKKYSGGLMPHRDNATRWNSWYEMLDWTLRKIRPAIIAISNEDVHLSTDILGAEEWKTLTYIRDFLQPFLDATKSTEGHQAGLDRVLPTLDFLLDHFEEAADIYADHLIMRESIQTG